MYPTTNQPVMDTTLKDMLLSLRSTLQSDMLSFMQHFKQEVTTLGNHISQVESNMTACATTVNDIIDTQSAHNDEHKWIDLAKTTSKLGGSQKTYNPKI